MNKKLLLVLLASMSLASWWEEPGDWEKEFVAVDPCGNIVTFEHTSDKIYFMDLSHGLIYATPDKLDIETCSNGCTYDISLNVDMTEDEFKSELSEAGFVLRVKPKLTSS